MRCPGCGSEMQSGVGARCARCGFLQGSTAAGGVAVTPMEYVVRIPTGLHHLDGGMAARSPFPPIVRVLYGSGLAIWILPIALFTYFRFNPMPGASTGWRVLGIVLAVILALLVNVLCWAAAFFYSRFVSSDEIGQHADRATNS